MHHKRREDMARKMAAAARYRSFVGATVLEIGADRHGVSAAMLAGTGSARVISTNFRDDWPRRMDGTIERRRLDARCIAESFAQGSIDIVFGVAILEHIDGLDAFFAGARHALKPDGYCSRMAGRSGPRPRAIMSASRATRWSIASATPRPTRSAIGRI